MERLSIGDLARATGLTVRALRHYQDLGLLIPAGVDPATHYRTYGPEQLERARAIARLRRLGGPWIAFATTWPPPRPTGGGCSRTTEPSWTPGSAPPLSSSRS